MVWISRIGEKKTMMPFMAHETDATLGNSVG
jgi:hypothetical protein